MKAVSLLLFSSLAFGAVLKHEARQDSSSFEALLKGLEGALGNIAAQLPYALSGVVSNVLKTEKPWKIENVEGKLRPEAKRVKVYWGPYNLPAVDKNAPALNIPFLDQGAVMWNSLLEGAPKDATYLYLNTSIVYEDGSDATINSGIYTHHFGFYDIDKKGKQASTCPGLTPPQPALIGGNAEEKGDSYFTSTDGKFNSGFYVGKDDKIMTTAELINYSPEAKKVYSMVEIEYVPGKVKDALDVSLQSFSVTGCGPNLAIMPKENEKTLRATGQPVPILLDGYILATTGHLHDGGVNLITKLNGEVICDSQAQYGGGQSTATLADGKTWQTINHMTRCIDPIPVKKGDNVTIEANYDFEKHPVREHVDGGESEVMGIAFMAFAAPL